MDTPRAYGWLKDNPDRDDSLYAFFNPRDFFPADIPDVVDLKEFCSPVEDQGEFSSCTACALTSALEFLELKNPDFSLAFEELSRLFLYYNERLRLGEQFSKVDSGARLRDGIKSLADEGICPEVIWKYSRAHLTKKPNAKCYTRASHHRIKNYFNLNSRGDLLQCLAYGFPFVFGFTAYESFESAKVISSGIVPLPGNNERPLGGHACLCIGYNKTERTFLCKNSYGKDWGMDGYFTMPFDYLFNINMSADFWTIRR